MSIPTRDAVRRNEEEPAFHPEPRSQLDRLLHPENTAVTLETVSRAARVLGKRLVVKIVDPPASKRKLAKAAAS